VHKLDLLDMDCLDCIQAEVPVTETQIKVLNLVEFIPLETLLEGVG